jgi:hypothetical protein
LPNIFQALSRYGSSQSENYLTEAFIHVLRMLRERCPQGFQHLIANIAGISPEDIESELGEITIAGQASLPQGRPDIRFDFPDGRIVFVEVKDWSPLSEGQLEGYFKQIRPLFGAKASLVLLTRSKHSMQETTLDPSSYRQICWYEIYAWLGEFLTDDAIAGHYVDEFREFLEGRGMGVQQVTWEYEKGVRSMIILTNMLETATAEVAPHRKTKRTAGWSWRGLYIDDVYFLGVRYEAPMIISFEDNMGTNPTLKEDLDLAEAHFFSLSAGQQLETISDFLRSAFAKAGEEDKGED